MAPPAYNYGIADMGFAMRMAQLAGIAVTAAVVLGVDLDVRWATLLGVLSGALTIFVVTMIEMRSRS